MVKEQSKQNNSTFINSKQITSEAQVGFREDYSTTDQIFTHK